jgi:hypothetical protein
MMRNELFARKYLTMSFINRPNAIANQHADCTSVPSKPLSTSQIKQQHQSQNKSQCNQDSHNIPQNNVVYLASIRKPEPHEEAANFKYPMLECS